MVGDVYWIMINTRGRRDKSVFSQITRRLLSWTQTFQNHVVFGTYTLKLKSRCAF
jgi:hypothetical protein